MFGSYGPLRFSHHSFLGDHYYDPESGLDFPEHLVRRNWAEMEREVLDFSVSLPTKQPDATQATAEAETVHQDGE